MIKAVNYLKDTLKNKFYQVIDMKKKQTLPIICMIIFVSFAVCISAQSLEEPIKVGVYDIPPKIYIDEEGKVKGLWADITNYIAEKEGWEIEYVEGTWSEGLSRLESGEIDVMVDVAVSDKRKELYDFNQETMVVNWASVYAKKGLNIKTISDLEGRKIATLEKGIHYSGPLGMRNILKAFGINAEFVFVDSYRSALETVNNNQADAAVVNKIFGMSDAGNFKNVQHTGIVFNPIELRYAFTKDSPKNEQITQAIDKNLIELKENPGSVYYKSLETHLPSIIEKTEEDTSPLSGLKWTLWIVGLLAVIFVLTSFYLRRQIKKKKEAEKQKEEKEKNIT